MVRPYSSVSLFLKLPRIISPLIVLWEASTWKDSTGRHVGRTSLKMVKPGTLMEVLHWDESVEQFPEEKKRKKKRGKCKST
ncbi:hypothetical protein GE061_006692 [Apolygus lucorum]|uniref:Uncharacterized protein n=1 Tax=Apolygus lucorum TaxID=248454 RepID=A0A8S9WVY3_APOLU|nr:hypothetical protein GE061_006692 [Apolygus lucorum]